MFTRKSGAKSEPVTTSPAPPSAASPPTPLATWDGRIAAAAALLERREISQAIATYSALIEERPGYAEGFYKRANALNALGRFSEALADYDRAIAIEPRYANAYCNRGTVLERMGRLEEALESYDRTLALNPGDAITHYNRGSVLSGLGRREEAVASYARATALRPDYVEAYVNRGNTLQELLRHEAALADFDKAIALRGVQAEAFRGRGYSLFFLKRYEEAIESYEHAVALDSGQRWLLGLELNAHMYICRWDQRARQLQESRQRIERQEASFLPFQMLALVDAPELHAMAARIWVRETCPPSGKLGPIARRARGEKIRIGYFSADFRDHPVARLTVELIERHDRSRFEITAFAFGPQASGALRARLQSAFDRFIDVSALSDLEAARLARETGIDIAVDLGGLTDYSRTGILALRAAPIQLSYIGYLGTLGAPYMDYLIADPVLVPAAARSQYAEKIAYLPWYQANDSRRAVPEHRFSRESLGLPPHGFVFCCFNALYKLTPDMFACWMRILHRVPGSVLYVYADNRAAMDNLRREAQGHSVDPSRIFFGPRVGSDDYLARYCSMDLFLDTMPYNAGTTGSDALWAGLPVLTLMGRSLASRMGASLLQAIGLPELITETAEQYENLAVRLAGDPVALEGIRRRLRENRRKGSLFDTPRFTRHLESTYLRMYERHQADLPPAHLESEEP